MIISFCAVTANDCDDDDDNDDEDILLVDVSAVDVFRKFAR